MFSSVLISLIKDNVAAINNSNTLAHSPRIIDVQDISKISLETQKYLKDVQNSSPSSDEVSNRSILRTSQH